MTPNRWRTSALLLAALVCLPALAPALAPGWFEGHDDLHIYRLVEYDLALRDGQIPPRWFPDVSAGYGNPHPIYYAPLFYLTAEIFHLAGAGVILSLKGAILVFLLGAAVAMYHYARLFLGPAASLVAAAAYTYAPYHLLDLYVRKAFSEFTVFAFLPLLLLAFHNLRVRGSRWDMILGALAMAGMSTAHTISTMMAPALLTAYALVLTLRYDAPDRENRWRWVGRAAAAMTIGYAIAGFFMAPAFLERNEINLKIYTEAYVDYHKHFVYPQQLIWWPWDFGMSLPGLKDKMSFRLGLLQIAGTLLSAWFLYSRPRGGPAARTGRTHALFFAGLTVVAVFMTLPASTAVWGLLPPLKFVQFPWRFLTLTTLSTAFLCGYAFHHLAPARREPWGPAWAVCAVFALSAWGGGTLGVHLRVPEARVGFEEKPYNNMIDLGPDVTSPPEPFDGSFVKNHTLRWIDHLPPDVSFMGLNQTDLDRPRIQVESGSGEVSGLTSRSWITRFHVEAATPIRMRANIYRFPGWTVRADGAEIPLVEVPKQRRVIFFDLPAGSHDVEVVFERTRARWIGDLLTLAGLGALALLGLWPRRQAGAPG